MSYAGVLHQALRAHRVGLVTYVPDAGHRDLIVACQADDAIRTVALTTEEEGVAVAVGAWAGGLRSALLMQSSGVGNCVNMLSLVRTTRVPFLAVVTMRGEWGEENPWQVPMGQSTPAVLAAAGVAVLRVDRRDEVGDTIEAALRLAFSSSCAVAVLLGQRMIGAKAFVEG
jgi:sulfopyruvate decarboxylase alpha subunit